MEDKIKKVGSPTQVRNQSTMRDPIHLLLEPIQPTMTMLEGIRSHINWNRSMCEVGRRDSIPYYLEPIPFITIHCQNNVLFYYFYDLFFNF